MRPGGEVITPMRILRSASNLYDQSTFYQRSETSSSCAGRELKSFCNLRSGETRLGVLGQCRKNHLITCVFCWGSAGNRREGHTKMRSNLLETVGRPVRGLGKPPSCAEYHFPIVRSVRVLEIRGQ